MAKAGEKQTDVVVRPATPEDAPAAAELIHLSGPRIHDQMFAGDSEAAKKTIEHVFRTPGALFSFDNAVVAEVNGRILGCMVTYDREAERTQGRRYFKEVFRVLPKRLYARMFLHMMGMRWLVRPIRTGSLYGGSIAVRAEAQGTGVGLALLEACRRQIADRGFARLEADMEIDNAKAWRVYEKFGYSITATRRAGPLASFLGLQGFHRLELKG